MKLLVLTTSQPKKNTARRIFVNELVSELSKINPIKIIWVICQPNKFSREEDDFESICGINEFKHGLDLVKQLNPDIILVNSSKEILQYSVSIAASFLKIPLIGFSVSKFTSQSNLESIKYNTINHFFSNKVPTDDETQKKFLRRGRFMIYKLLFSLKTQFAIKLPWNKIFKNTVNDLSKYFFNKPLQKNELIDLHLLQQPSQMTSYENDGIPKNKLIVIGSILMDKIYEKCLKHNYNLTTFSQKKILILTDSLFEHGLWTSKQRYVFLKTLFRLLNNISGLQFSIKIHPSNENIDFYKNLLDELQIKTHIFQSEDLWEIIKDYNLIISYGISTTHTEIACSTKKMILLNDETNLPYFPLIPEAMSTGCIEYCNNIENLSSMIDEFLAKEIIISEKFKKKRNELFYKLDGKSTERAANAIVNLVNNIT